MKAKLMLVLSLICLLASSTTFACCGGAYAYYPSPCASCQQQPPSCDPVESPCQCTDPHCGLNSCLSRKECCEAFGNVGAR